MNQFRYRQQVIRRIEDDYKELTCYYPFSSIVFFDNNAKYAACIKTVAASIELINAINGKEEDFTREYSKTIYVFVPWDYYTSGCQVYGCGWIDFSIVLNDDKHFYVDYVTSVCNKRVEQTFLLTPFGYRMCVGTPESFVLLKNVVLENVKTADNMLVGYERMMRGICRRLNVRSYRHGNLGRKEFAQERILQQGSSLNDNRLLVKENGTETRN